MSTSPLTGTAPSPSPRSRRARRRTNSYRRIAAVLLLVGVAGLVAGIIAGTNATEIQRGSGRFVGTATVDVTGSFLVPQDFGSFTEYEGSCSLSVGFSDFTQGAPVTIQNSDGKTFVGELGVAGSYDDDCLFPFEVDDVEIADGDYLVTFSHRGTLAYSLDELRDGLALSLGD